MNALEILSNIYTAENDEEMLRAIDKLSARQKDLLIMRIFKTLKAGDMIKDLQGVAESMN